MAAKAIKTTAAAVDRCQFCQARFDGGFGSRIRHLRKEHPALARGLLLRLAAPVAFFVILLALQALAAPAWTLVLAVAAGGGLALAGVAVSRSGIGDTDRPSLRKQFLQGGYRFVLLAGGLVVMVILASGR